ncbi:MAG: sigma-70 family RNA polymerase sigma factor [Lachnospiraceae bacterium]|nr:sigma-70 family RNA polymerase sigma factor [Lachnospiraceae bacterium]MDD7629089.1 sigma-70 family RNA polymerase sigma factor [Lachnospiraceae bacterium]MDY4118647.1 sigma-70 family RNA polymerase sigma factor [Lachnospiraceae bacterium]
MRTKKAEAELTAEEIIDRYADMVYRLAVSQAMNRTDADDIFQEVFVRLVRHVKDLQDMEHAKAWLIRVTINCTKKHFGQYWNKNVFPIEETEEVPKREEGFEQVEKKIDNPVMQAVSKLPPKYRGCVHLFYFEELSVKEIAEMTDQTESTVKSQLHRARKMLKEMLGDIS